MYYLITHHNIKSSSLVTKYIYSSILLTVIQYSIIANHLPDFNFTYKAYDEPMINCCVIVI